MKSPLLRSLLSLFLTISFVGCRKAELVIRTETSPAPSPPEAKAPTPPMPKPPTEREPPAPEPPAENDKPAPPSNRLLLQLAEIRDRSSVTYRASEVLNGEESEKLVAFVEGLDADTLRLSIAVFEDYRYAYGVSAQFNFKVSDKSVQITPLSLVERLGAIGTPSTPPTKVLGRYADGTRASPAELLEHAHPLVVRLLGDDYDRPVALAASLPLPSRADEITFPANDGESQKYIFRTASASDFEIRRPEDKVRTWNALREFRAPTPDGTATFHLFGDGANWLNAVEKDDRLYAEPLVFVQRSLDGYKVTVSPRRSIEFVRSLSDGRLPVHGSLEGLPHVASVRLAADGDMKSVLAEAPLSSGPDDLRLSLRPTDLPSRHIVWLGYFDADGRLVHRRSLVLAGAPWKDS